MKLFSEESTNAHRLSSNSEAWVERFDGDILISYKSEAMRDQMLEQFHLWADSQGFRYQRVFGKHLPKQNAERNAPILIEGDPQLSMQTVAMENGLRFGLDFAAGYSAGLFIDQRANRKLTRRLKPRRILNCFSYTCSFSVVAAMEGAVATSIDLSKKSLQRGRDNFEMNGLDPTLHRFIADDVLDMIPRLARKGEKFDIIILDPPTFSRGANGRPFQVEKQFEALLLAAMETAERDAKILLSTNCARMNRRMLESISHYCVKAARSHATYHKAAALPDVAPEFAAESLWLMLK